MTKKITPEQSTILQDVRAWPFEEARRLIQRLEKIKDGLSKTVLFETGYGPSGLPHIGTFGEVVRTTMVRRAFEAMNPGSCSSCAQPKAALRFGRR